MSGPAPAPVPEPWQEPLDAWASWLAAAGQVPGTILMRRRWVRRFAADHPHLGPWDTSCDDLVAWLGSRQVGPNTRRVVRQSLRGFYRWARSTGRTDVDPAADLPAIRPPRAAPRPAPEAVILAALDGADQRQRDAIELGALAGLRRAEIARVHTDDLDHRPDGWELLVPIGKGGHPRVVPLPDELGERLASRPRGWIFPNGKGGHVTPAHLGVILRPILSGKWTLHTLRHRYATSLRADDVQLDVIQDLLGHARIETTRIYAAVPTGARRAAVASAALGVVRAAA